MSEITVDWEETRRRAADKAAAWPELYIPAQGGTAGDTVDLSPLWQRASGIRHERVREQREREHGGIYVAPDDPTVDMLAEEAGGLALRLRAGVTSLTNRRDSNVHVAEVPEGPVVQEGIGTEADGAITITMWSTEGHWTDRAWWATTRAFVHFDEYGEVAMLAPEAELVVVSGDNMFPRGENPFGNVTRFLDRHPRSSVLGSQIAAAYRAWLARAGVRGIIAHQPAPDMAPIASEEFLREL
ncbi:hypothetical protein [Actinomadura sp. 3N407]|uniref:hypothetical protein n=1 Tax=Actinomadura sp. 3N407 TaxID=3457423 RepID=UPI003FCD037F